MADSIPYVSVAGLSVPATVVPRILAALRGTYPQQTAGRDDKGALQAVLLHWLLYTVTDFEATHAADPSETAAQIEALIEDQEKKVKTARAQAQAALSTIVPAETAPPSDVTLDDFAGLVPINPS